MIVELVKPYGDNVAGDQIDVDDAVAELLVNDGIAKHADEVKEEDNEEVKEDTEEEKDEEKSFKSIENKLVKSVEKTMTTIAKNFAKPSTVSAVAKDKFNGIKDINEMLRMVKGAKQNNSYCRNKLKPFEFTKQMDDAGYAEYKRITGTKVPAGANFTTPAEGGYAIPQEWTAKLSERPQDDVPDLVGMTRQESVSGNYLHIPGFATSTESNSGELNIDGIQGGYSGEGVAFTPSKATLGDKHLLLKKLYAYLPFTNEILADASYDLTGRIQSRVMYWFDRKKAEMIISGAGTTQPTGILNYTALITVAKEAGPQAAKTFNFENAKKMYNAMWIGSQNKAVWLMNPLLWSQLVGMTFTSGGTTSAFGGLTFNAHDEFPLRLFARPIIASLACSTPGLLGDVIYADLSQIVSIKKEMLVAVSEDIGFGTDETYFRFTERHDWDIDTCWPDKLTPRNGGSNYYSPFVALESRGS